MPFPTTLAGISASTRRAKELECFERRHHHIGARVVQRPGSSDNSTNGLTECKLRKRVREVNQNTKSFYIHTFRNHCNRYDPAPIQVSERFDFGFSVRHLAVDQERTLAFDKFDHVRDVFGHRDCRCDHQATSVRHPQAQVGQLRARAFDHRRLVPVQLGGPTVQLVLGTAGKPVEVQRPLEARDAFEPWSKLRWGMTGDLDSVPAFKIDRELALVPMKGHRSAVSELDSLAIRQCVRPLLRMVDRTHVVVCKPNRLGTVSPDRRACEDKSKCRFRESVVRSFSPCSFDGRMVMFIANDQGPVRAANCLKGVNEPLDGSPSSADIDLERFNVGVAACLGDRPAEWTELSGPWLIAQGRLNF